MVYPEMSLEEIVDIWTYETVFVRSSLSPFFDLFYPHSAKFQPDPVVQSIVSLMSLLRGQLVKCFMTL